jgi:tetratricopeptide (TPR) repeat protein
MPIRRNLAGVLRAIPWRWVAPFSIVLLILGAFLPAIMAELVFWDDDDLLLGTILYRDINWSKLKWMFTTSYAGHYQPLAWLTFSLDWAIWHREYAGYHLTSVLFHAATALLVYALALRLMKTSFGRDSGSTTPTNLSALFPLTAAFCAALFALHPLRVESVAWLAERRDVVAGFFFVAAIAAYVRWCGHESAPRRTRLWYWLAVLLHLLSLLTRAGAVSLPLVLLIMDFFPLRRLEGRPWPARLSVLVWDKAPFLVLSIAAGVRAWVAQVETGAMYPLAEYDLPSRIAQMLYSMFFYPWKTVLPTHLGPLYQIPPRETLLGWILWKGLAGSVILLALAWTCRRRLPAVTAAIAAFVVIIAPISGVLQSGPQLVADRYSYLSCLGFALLPAACVVWMLRQYETAFLRSLGVVGLCGAVCVTALFHATATQSAIWSSALDLWARGVLVSPDSSIAHTNRADALMVLGNIPQAVEHYRRALQLNPRDAIAAHHFGEALADLGDLKGAEALLIHSLRMDPRRPRVFVDLAQLLVAMGRANEAVQLLQERIARAPDDMLATGFLAELLATHPDELIRDGCQATELAARASLALGHEDARALLIWASAQAEDGQWNDAIATAQRGLALANKQRRNDLSYEFQRRIRMFSQELPYHHGD